MPQGSVLLFLIFINDLDSDVISSVLKFADDAKVFSNDNHDNERITVQKYLNKFYG